MNRTRSRFTDGALPLDGVLAADFIGPIDAAGAITRARTSSASMNASPLAMMPRESETLAEVFFQSFAIEYAASLVSGTAPPADRLFIKWTIMAP